MEREPWDEGCRDSCRSGVYDCVDILSSAHLFEEKLSSLVLFS